MIRALTALCLGLMALPVQAQETDARAVVTSSAAEKVAVTVYRDPDRGLNDSIDKNWPKGFALITETREVTLPAGPSTIRFEGVTEGMVAVTAIVSGLPGGTIERNRDAALLSPASLIDGSLGNRVTIRRTDPATGVEEREDAIIRTRADGGLVLQTYSGFEAVQCSGIPETLEYAGIPGGLSPQPVFSINTNSAVAGTYKVTLTYLSSGFDWQADYVAVLGADNKTLGLTAWLTLANDNGQSFEQAELLAVAGQYNVESDYREMADPPTAPELALTCYPLGSSMDGSAYEEMLRGGSVYPVPEAMYSPDIVVTARMRQEVLMDAAVAVSAVTAEQEELGDLKLYRVPEPVTVAAKGMKQVAFLTKADIKLDRYYWGKCSPWNDSDPEREPESLAIALRMQNRTKDGLGVPLLAGGIAVFQDDQTGRRLIGEASLRDYAVEQEVEFLIAESAQVFQICQSNMADDSQRAGMTITLSNAGAVAVPVEIELGYGRDWAFKAKGGRIIRRNGMLYLSAMLGANKTQSWKITARSNEVVVQEE